MRRLSTRPPRERNSSSGGIGAANLRTGFEKIIRKAGLVPWPRLFHNLRSSRQTELTDRHPAHVVAGWMGNSEEVARRHYLQTTDEHFQNALPETPELVGCGWNSDPEKARSPAFLRGFSNKECTKLVPQKPLISRENTGVPSERAAESAADPAGNELRRAESVAGGGSVDPLLNRLVAAWPGLTDGDRRAVVELVERLVAVRDGVVVDG